MSNSPVMFRPLNGRGEAAHMKIDGESIGVHQHIDNGGHTFIVDQHGGMTIETGFHGYSHTSVFLMSPDLDSLISFLQRAQTFVKQYQEG